MLVQTQMDLNSLLHLDHVIGKFYIKSYLLFYRLDGYHVTFGEMVEGEETLRKIELAGSRSGQPTSKLVVEECGQIKKEEAK